MDKMQAHGQTEADPHNEKCEGRGQVEDADALVVGAEDPAEDAGVPAGSGIERTFLRFYFRHRGLREHREHLRRKAFNAIYRFFLSEINEQRTLVTGAF